MQHSSWCLGFLNLHLEVRGSFTILSKHYNLGINIFHRTYTIIFYPLLFYFYIACIDQAGIKVTKRKWHRFSTSGRNAVRGSRFFESTLGS